MCQTTSGFPVNWPRNGSGQYDARMSVEQRRPDAGYLLYFLAQASFVPNEEQLLKHVSNTLFWRPLPWKRCRLKSGCVKNCSAVKNSRLICKWLGECWRKATVSCAWPNEHLEEVALTDRLTGAWNRRKFEETAEQEMLRSQRYREAVSILLIDIDFFKQINDEHGHLLGDQV